MIDQTDIPVSSILSPPLPPTNFYFLAIMRIHDVKFGPFHEHSSQLHSIAAGVPNWGKVNSGLFKMFEVRSRSVHALRSGSDVLTLRTFLFPNQAEVLGKRVVCSNIPLGGLLEWENIDNPAPSTASSVSQGSTPQSANQIYPSTAPPRAPSRPAPARAVLPPMMPPTASTPEPLRHLGSIHMQARKDRQRSKVTRTPRCLRWASWRSGRRQE